RQRPPPRHSTTPSRSAPRAPRANASATGSRPRPSARGAPPSSSPRLCPPRPTVQSTNRPPRAGASRSSTSATITGSCNMASDAELRKSLRVVVRVRITLQLGDEALVIPDVQPIYLPEHVDLACHAGRVPQPWVDHHASLRIDFRRLPVITHAVEKFEPRGVR